MLLETFLFQNITEKLVVYNLLKIDFIDLVLGVILLMASSKWTSYTQKQSISQVLIPFLLVFVQKEENHMSLG